MQIIEFEQKKKPEQVVHIDDIQVHNRKIYCVHYEKELRFLIKRSGCYYWNSLGLSDYMPASSISQNVTSGYLSLKDAFGGYPGCKAMIFDTQDEVFEYARSM